MEQTEEKEGVEINEFQDQERVETKNNFPHKNAGTIFIPIVIIIIILSFGVFLYNKGILNGDQELLPTPTIKPSGETPTPATEVQTPTPVNKIETNYTNSDLPGFSVSYNPNSWSAEIKEFGDSNSNAFTSKYKSSCDSRCLGLRLSHGLISLETVFQIAFDDETILRCSNENIYTVVNPNWVRLEDKSGTYYSPNTQFDHTPSDDECYQYNAYENQTTETYGNSWSCSAETTYSICDSYTGVFLNQKSAIEPGNDGNGVLILMEKPIISGNPNKEQLQQLDEMITSITY